MNGQIDFVNVPPEFVNQAVPNGPMRAAARAGPTMRDPVITVVFRLIAFEMSCGSTSSVTRPRRAGLSMAFATPSTMESP